MTPRRAVERGTPSRRRVLRGAIAAGTCGIGLAAGATNAIGSAGASESREPTAEDTEDVTEPRADGAEVQTDAVADLPLFDAHTHLIPEPTLDRDPLTAADLVDWMDDGGVDRAVVHALDSPESYPVQAPSWWVLDQVEPYANRLVPFCTVDPRTLVYEEDTVETLIERCVERGARGFGELKPGLPIDDPRLETVYELCAAFDLPILLHTDQTAMTDAVGLPGLEDALAAYPEVDFVAHAHGWWAHVSADVDSADLGRLPEGPVEPGGRVPELLDAYDNVYGDLAGLTGWNALTRDEAFGQAFLERHHDQLIFGTDYLYPGQEVPQRDLFDRFDLDRQAWANVRYRNLEGILR